MRGSGTEDLPNAVGMLREFDDITHDTPGFSISFKKRKSQNSVFGPRCKAFFFSLKTRESHQKIVGEDPPYRDMRRLVMVDGFKPPNNQLATGRYFR